MSALSLTSWTREMGESPISEQQSGSLVIALKQRHPSSKFLLAQKAVSVSLGTQTAFTHYLCCFILLQNRLR